MAERNPTWIARFHRLTVRHERRRSPHRIRSFRAEAAGAAVAHGSPPEMAYWPRLQSAWYIAAAFG